VTAVRTRERPKVAAASIIDGLVEELKPWKKPDWRQLLLEGPIDADGTFPPGSFWVGAPPDSVWADGVIVEGRLIAIPKDERAKAWAIAKQEAKLETEVTNELHERVKLLSSVTLDFLTRSKIRETRAGARKIQAAIRNLQAQLKNASPELRLRLDMPGTWQGPLRAEQVGMHRLQAELEHLREVCDTAANAQPGWDPIKKVCAQIGVGLVLKYSSKPPTAGRRGALRTIVSLLFEAATGEHDADLTRACRDALREWKRALT
jgi:hypothetical protein